MGLVVWRNCAYGSFGNEIDVIAMHGYTQSMEGRRVGSLSTGLQVLESLAAIPNGASVTDLARELQLDKGYLHRLLRTLGTGGLCGTKSVDQDLHALSEVRGTRERDSPTS